MRFQLHASVPAGDEGPSALRGPDTVSRPIDYRIERHCLDRLHDRQRYVVRAPRAKDRAWLGNWSYEVVDCKFARETSLGVRLRPAG